MPRALEIFTDSVTGEQRIFCALGNPGILSGVYDSTLPAKIRWDRDREIKGLAVRPLGMAVVNGVLWFSAGAQLYRRNDGQKPTYTVAVTMSNSSVNPDSGGIRGITPIAAPPTVARARTRNSAERNESVIFMFIPNGKARGSTGSTVSGMKRPLEEL